MAEIAWELGYIVCAVDDPSLGGPILGGVRRMEVASEAVPSLVHQRPYIARRVPIGVALLQKLEQGQYWVRSGVTSWHLVDVLPIGRYTSPTPFVGAGAR